MLYSVRIDMEGGHGIDVILNVTDSTIKFTKLPEKLLSEDWAAIQDFLTACGRLMRNPRMMRADLRRET